MSVHHSDVLLYCNCGHVRVMVGQRITSMKINIKTTNNRTDFIFWDVGVVLGSHWEAKGVLSS